VLVLTLGARALAVAGLTVGWHGVAAYVLPSATTRSGAGELAWGVVGVVFLLLFVLKTALRLAPDGRLARALYPSLFAGFYLDQRITRVTFRAWPPRFPAHVDGHALSATPALALPQSHEARS
jgi:NAD(P)H-quinone oxidoreductase subunit 5